MAKEEKPADSNFVPEPYPLTTEERARVMAKLKADFSAADLQRFTEVEEDIPMEQVIKEIEELYKRRIKESK